MKTAISIPDSVFKEAEKLAKEMHISRSKLYTEALIYFVDFQEKGGITGALNKIYGEESASIDKKLRKMQNKSIKEQW